MEKELKWYQKIGGTLWGIAAFIFSVFVVWPGFWHFYIQIVFRDITKDVQFGVFSACWLASSLFLSTTATAIFFFFANMFLSDYIKCPIFFWWDWRWKNGEK